MPSTSTTPVDKEEVSVGTLHREKSQDTLQASEIANELHTFHSRSSTMTESAFGRSIHEFNHIRTLPVVSPLFKKGLYVFASENALVQYRSDKQETASVMPLLRAVQNSSLGFKRSQPIMIFYKFSTPKDQITYCRVFAKSMKDEYGVTRYTFKFSPNGKEEDDEDNFEVVMFSCTNAPVNDCSYRGTKLRWIGSTLAEPVKSFKLLVLNNDILSLCDDMDPSNPLPNAKAQLDFGLQNTGIPPLARFVEHKPPSKRGLTQTADIKAIEVFVGESKDSVTEVPESTLVVSCMSMLLEERRKNMGSSKSYDTTMFA